MRLMPSLQHQVLHSPASQERAPALLRWFSSCFSSAVPRERRLMDLKELHSPLRRVTWFLASAGNRVTFNKVCGNDETVFLRAEGIAGHECKDAVGDFERNSLIALRALLRYALHPVGMRHTRRMYDNCVSRDDFLY